MKKTAQTVMRHSSFQHLADGFIFHTANPGQKSRTDLERDFSQFFLHCLLGQRGVSIKWREQDKEIALKWVREGLRLILTAKSIVTLVTGSAVE